jgi:hypothetical protein
MPTGRLSHLSNRTIIGIGVLLCAAGAFALAYLLGLLDEVGWLP